jgi:hypothetical protein
MISPAIDAIVAAIALDPVPSGLTENAIVGYISQKPIIPGATVDRYRGVVKMGDVRSTTSFPAPLLICVTLIRRGVSAFDVSR